MASGVSAKRKQSATVGSRPAALEQTSGAAEAGVQSDPVDPAIDREEIARLAHSYWEARGCSGGSAEEDWFRAETELKKSTANQRR